MGALMRKFADSPGGSAASETHVVLSAASETGKSQTTSFAIQRPSRSTGLFAALRVRRELSIRRCTGARAFTLIELLVVISIIAVIAALGTSAWQRSQRNSRAVACMQHLRQIGGGLARYVAEHDGTFPSLVMARASKKDDVPVIDTELRGYVPDARVFACPDDRKHLAETSGTSYLWNMRLNGQRLANLSVSFVKMDPIDDPSRIMVLGDKEGFHPYLDSKLNVLYADGHASQELTFVDDASEK